MAQGSISQEAGQRQILMGWLSRAHLLMDLIQVPGHQLGERGRWRIAAMALWCDGLQDSDIQWAVGWQIVLHGLPAGARWAAKSRAHLGQRKSPVRQKQLS